MYLEGPDCDSGEGRSMTPCWVGECSGEVLGSVENDNLKGDGRAQWTPGKATSREKLCESWLCLTLFGLWCVVLEVGVFARKLGEV